MIGLSKKGAEFDGKMAAALQSAAEQFLPLVDNELRKLAAQRMAQKKPGQTLQATALVHEAYLRLVGGEEGGHRESRAQISIETAHSLFVQRLDC